MITDHKANDDILPDIAEIDDGNGFAINPVCGKMIDQVFDPLQTQLGQRFVEPHTDTFQCLHFGK